GSAPNTTATSLRRCPGVWGKSTPGSSHTQASWTWVGATTWHAVPPSTASTASSRSWEARRPTDSCRPGTWRPHPLVRIAQPACPAEELPFFGQCPPYCWLSRLAASPPGDLIARALVDADAGPIFTLNGGHIWGLYLGAENLGLRMFDVRREQTAGFAAEGWARVTRPCGVAAVTAGPGVTNTVSAIAAAQQNDSPVLFLGGRAPTSRWGMGSLQEIDHVPMVGAPTQSAHTISAAGSAHPKDAGAGPDAAAARTRAGAPWAGLPARATRRVLPTH